MVNQKDQRNEFGKKLVTEIPLSTVPLDMLHREDGQVSRPGAEVSYPHTIRKDIE